jgi:hypothetical protein
MFLRNQGKLATRTNIQAWESRGVAKGCQAFRRQCGRTEQVRLKFRKNVSSLKLALVDPISQFRKSAVRFPITDFSRTSLFKASK